VIAFCWLVAMRDKQAAIPVPQLSSSPTVPVAGAGDSEKLSTIKGRVIGARPGQQIVLYAKGETAWWVQPFVDQPFTTIHPNSKWRNVTHPGTDDAALLVGPGISSAAHQ